ncbi:flagellar filament capping protein FliD [Arhodomonas sp. AD133]|uniref:flagellar filament capping protein FliD n=1 Tax=Arhodomonas sp. AD133 TaxID=3415009 RepID=UPI003EB73A83
MSTITSLGIGSGLDINKTVSDLVSAEREPVAQRLNEKQQEYETRFSAYGALKSAVSVFRDSLDALGNENTYVQRSAESSNSDIFTANATESALDGSYSIEVLARAQAHKLTSAADKNWSEGSTIGTGTLTVSSGGSSFDVEIDSNNNTLAGIRDAINGAESNSGVTASIINVDNSNGDTEARLVLTADDPGADNAVTVAVSGDGDGNDSDGAGLSALRYDATANNLTESQAATDAEIKVDGQTATRSSNSIDDVIAGVSIDLEKAEPGTVETLTVERNDGDVRTAIDDLVNGYNTLMKTVGNLTKYNKETEEAAVLLGDAATRGLELQLRQGLTDAVSELDGDIRSLADIGVSVGADRQLSVDSERLDTVLSENLDEVKALFTGDDGVASRLEGITDAYMDEGGVIDSRQEGLQDRLEGIAEQRETLDRRMSNLEQRYLNQFIAMDQIVAQMNATQDRLTQGLASLPGLVQESDG